MKVRLEHFRAKWTPVRVKKMRPNKNLERFRDSVKFGNALALSALLMCSLFSASPSWGQDRATDLPPKFELVLPIDCKIGETCFIQNYVDVDPSRRWRDYQCRGLSNDGHKGTDFRLPDLAAMERGVAVVAAAAGRVKGYRKNLADGLYFNGDTGGLEGKTCGNGVIIDHGNGWETQYCHLKQDSVDVVRGRQISAGESIGLVGLSGATNFPHLHFEVRYQDQVMDPATGASSLDGCGSQSEPLWTTADLFDVRYTPRGVLNQGFTTEDVTPDGIERGLYGDTEPTGAAPAMVYYVRIFGLQSGDVQELSILDPQGNELVATSYTHEGRSQLDHTEFVKAVTQGQGWAPGTYEGRYRLTRGGKILLERSLTTEIGEAG